MYAPVPNSDARTLAKELTGEGREQSGPAASSRAATGHMRLETDDPISAEKVADWLLSAKDDVVLAALLILARGRRELLGRALTSVQRDSTDAPPPDGAESHAIYALRAMAAPNLKPQLLTVEGQKLRSQTKVKDLSEYPPIIQFSSFQFFCSEDDGCVKVDVLRIGGGVARKSRSEVKWRTKDASAKSGVTYKGASGKVVFEPNEVEKSIEIELIESEQWDSTLEFAVELLDDELENGTIGRYGSTVRIKVIDNDCFPSNKYREVIEKREVHNMTVGGKFSLLMEYIKLNWQNQKIRQRSRRIMFIDWLHNLWGFLHLFLNVYMVDFVLSVKRSDDDLILVKSKHESLILIVVCTVTPFAILHYLDHKKKAEMGVGGGSRSFLQISILRKFLNYDSEARAYLNKADLITAMTRDCQEVVSGGYQNMLDVIKHFGALFFMLAYQAAAPIVFKKRFSVLGSVPLVLFPFLMALFFKYRSDLTNMMLKCEHEASSSLISAVDETVNNYKLIAFYNRRSRVIDQFEGCIKNFNKAAREAGMVLNNNLYFGEWILTVVIAVWIIVGGLDVLDGIVSLGMFLANINIFTKIGHSWNQIYKIFLEMNSILPSMERVVVLMNLPTDTRCRKDLSNVLREETRKMRVEMAEKYPETKLPRMDLMPILVGNMRFSYVSLGTMNNGEEGEHLNPVNLNGMFELNQGELVCLFGPKGGGKSTLLKILGGDILPTMADLGAPGASRRSPRGDLEDVQPVSTSCPGRFFVPAHLRVIYVSEALFVRGTLHTNLSFGCQPGDADASMERVYAVCEMLAVSQKVLDHLKDDDVHDWPQVLSQTQCQLLNLARALITNPEVLCIHRPLTLFSTDTKQHVMEALREFVDGKGLRLDWASHFQRRPRTCIMTKANSEPSDKDMFNRCYQVSWEHGIVEMSKNYLESQLIKPESA